MQNITIKSSVYLLVGISALAWLSFAYFGELDLSQIKDFFRSCSKGSYRRSSLNRYICKMGMET